MPIYEYRCGACGFEKDALQKMSDPPLVVCPSCNASALVKLVSAAGFQLKGSGWYATDFKNSGSKPVEKAKADTGTAANATASDAPAGDAKAGESKVAETKSGDSKTVDTPAPAAKAEPAKTSTPSATGTSG